MLLRTPTNFLRVSLMSQTVKEWELTLWNLKFKLAQHGPPEAMLTPPLRFSHQLKTKMTVLISHSTLNLSSSKEV